MDLSFRIGQGYDVHALDHGLDMILGGVKIDFEKGCVAHSDGDVLAHAISDALLGAAALGDIGLHFPDTSEQYKGADSLALLKRVVEMLSEQQFFIVNIDATIVLQAPKLRPYIDDIRHSLASAMGLDVSQVSVKATTEEWMGITGDGRGIASHAVALISRK